MYILTLSLAHTTLLVYRRFLKNSSNNLKQQWRRWIDKASTPPKPLQNSTKPSTHELQRVLNKVVAKTKCKTPQLLHTNLRKTKNSANLPQYKDEREIHVGHMTLRIMKHFIITKRRCNKVYAHTNITKSTVHLRASDSRKDESPANTMIQSKQSF